MMHAGGAERRRRFFRGVATPNGACRRARRIGSNGCGCSLMLRGDFLAARLRSAIAALLLIAAPATAGLPTGVRSRAAANSGKIGNGGSSENSCNRRPQD